MSSQACMTCGSSDFYCEGGNFFCQRCHTESVSHGQETILDDETLPHGMAVETRAIKSASKIAKPETPFISVLDATTIVLRLLLKDCQKLGASDSVLETALHVFGKKLQILGMAFHDANIKNKKTYVPEAQEKPKLWPKKKKVRYTPDQDINIVKERRRKRRAFFRQLCADDSDAESSDFKSSNSSSSMESTDDSNVSVTEKGYVLTGTRRKRALVRERFRERTPAQMILGCMALVLWFDSEISPGTLQYWLQSKAVDIRKMLLKMQDRMLKWKICTYTSLRLYIDDIQFNSLTYFWEFYSSSLEVNLRTFPQTKFLEIYDKLVLELGLPTIFKEIMRCLLKIQDIYKVLGLEDEPFPSRENDISPMPLDMRALSMIMIFIRKRRFCCKSKRRPQDFKYKHGHLEEFKLKEWISKRRKDLFLMKRHSYILNERYNTLEVNVELSDCEKAISMQSKIKNHIQYYNFSNECSALKRKLTYAAERLTSQLKSTRDFSLSSARSTMISQSQTPCNDFLNMMENDELASDTDWLNDPSSFVNQEVKDNADIETEESKEPDEFKKFLIAFLPRPCPKNIDGAFVKHVEILERMSPETRWTLKYLSASIGSTPEALFLYASKIEYDIWKFLNS